MKKALIIFVATVSLYASAKENLFLNAEFKVDAKYGLKYSPWASNSDLETSSEKDMVAISGTIKGNVFQLVQQFNNLEGKYMVSVLYKGNAPVDMVRIMRYYTDSDNKLQFNGTNIMMSELPPPGEWKKLLGTIDIPEGIKRASVFFQVRGKEGTKVFFSTPLLQKVDIE